MHKIIVIISIYDFLWLFVFIIIIIKYSIIIMPIKMIESFYQCSYSYLSRIEIVQKTSLLPYPNLHIYASIGVELEYFAYWAQ